MNGFKGVNDGAYFYKALPPRRGCDGWRVRTFQKPMSVAAFLGGAIGRGHKCALVYERTEAFVPAELVVIDEGKVVATREGLAHIARLLSDSEVDLLRLFGVDLPPFAREAP